MDADRFRERLAQATAGWGWPAVLEEYCRIAADRARDDGCLDEDGLARAKDWIRSQPGVHLETGAPRDVLDEVTIDVPPDPAATALLVEKLEPWARRTRENLFGGSEPPFKTAEDCRPWLEEAWRRGRQPSSREENDRTFELEERVWEVKAELERLNGMRVVFGYDGVSVPCWLPETERPDRGRLEDVPAPDQASLRARYFIGQVGRTNVGPDSGKYWRFGLALDVVAGTAFESGTGFLRIDLADLVLTGRRPTLEPATIQRRGVRSAWGPGDSRTEGDLLGHSYLMIRLNSPLSLEELRKLHDGIRNLWRAAYDPPLDVQLLNLVVETQLDVTQRRGMKPADWLKVSRRLEELDYEKSTRPLTLAHRYLRRAGLVDY